MDELIIKSKIITEAQNIYKRGITIFNIQNPMTLNFSFSLRGRVAGEAKQNSIKYNIEIARLNFDTFMIDTVPHEVAHVICRQVYPRAKSHGREWKHIMVKLGYAPNRCHEMVYVPARITKKYEIFCDCRTHEVGLKVYNKIKNGKIYRCQLCHSVCFIGEES
jgi:SprT protein